MALPQTIMMLASFPGQVYAVGTSTYTASTRGLLANVLAADVNALQVLGAVLITPRNNFSATRAPASTDDFTAGYGIGSIWNDIPNAGTAVVYVCTAMGATAGNATWVAIAANVTGGLDGVFIDALGTGTSDDTSIWTAAIASAVALGFNRIYMKKPSKVKNLLITDPVEIIGVHGISSISITDSAVATDICINVTANYLKLKGVSILGPRYKWRSVTAYADPAAWPPAVGLLYRTGAFASVSSIQSELVLEDVTVIGFVIGIRVEGADRLVVNNVETSYCFGHGLAIGGGLPCTYVRVDGFLAVACGAYGLTLANIATGVAVNYGFHDLEFKNITLVDCGKYAKRTGYDGGGKFGCDLTTNSLVRMRAEIKGVRCESGACECKFTGPPPSGVGNPAIFTDIDLTVTGTQDVEGDSIVWIGGEGEIPTGSFRRAKVRGSATYAGPAAWAASTYFELGDAVTNGGKTYMCAGDANGIPGLTGTGGAPTGTGVGLGSYSDGNIYWEYREATSAVATGITGLKLNGVGSTSGWGITVENYEVNSCGYHTLLDCGGVVGHAASNIYFTNPIGRALSQGGIHATFLTDEINPSPWTGSFDNIHIIDPDLDCVTNSGLRFGRADGTTTISATNVVIIGGRVRSTAGEAIRFDGSVNSVKISGGARFSATANSCFAVTGSGTMAADVYDATFEDETTGHSTILMDSGVTGTLNFHGSVQAIQPDDTAYAINVPGGVAVQGQASRGFKGSTPTTAGHLGEVWKISVPTTTISRWDCTTTGAAGAAVWTLKP